MPDVLAHREEIMASFKSEPLPSHFQDANNSTFLFVSLQYG